MNKSITKINFWIILLSQMISFYFFMVIIPERQRIFLLALILLLIPASFFWSLLQSFTLLVSELLMVSLYHVFVVWHYGSLTQIEGISYSLITILFALLTWILIVYIKRYIEENETLRRRIKNLEKYNYELGVLTLNEFMERAEMIFSILKRRGGDAMLLKIKLKEFSINENEDGRKTSSGIMKILSREVLNSIRKEFDIVGMCSPNTLVILLQNTKTPEPVIERIKTNLSRIENINFDKIINDLEFETHYLKNDFQAFKEYIEKFCVGER